MPVPPLNLEEEGENYYALLTFCLGSQTLLIPDALIHSRIMNDEKSLRRLTKKFHLYSLLVFPSDIEPSTNTSVDEAREAFLLELVGFQLQLRKARMIYDAEHRQGDLYRKESRRIGVLLIFLRTLPQRLIVLGFD